MTKQLIQDWTDYNESILFEITSDYYKKMGVDAYSNKIKKDAIPSAVTNCFPHAISIAQIIKANLEKNYDKDSKITVLECGAGSGLFARHFLQACEKLGILDRIEYLISDYSAKALEHIAERGILEGFQEGKHYKFIELDLLDLSKVQSLASDNKISAVILNYVLDALPVTIVRANHNSEKTKFEELQIKLSSESDGEAKLKDLIKEERWEGYEEGQQSEVEKKYYSALLKFAEIVPEGHIYYNYASIRAIENLLSVCDDNGFIFAADMPPLDNNEDTYEVYGNTVAHPVNDNLLALQLYEQGIKSVRNYDHLLLRMLIMKNPDQEEFFQGAFHHEYIENNDTNVYIDLRKAINQIRSPHSNAIFDMLIKHFAVLDNYSCETFMFLAKFCEFMGSYKQAFEFYEKARALDFLDNYNVQEAIDDLLKNKIKG